MKKRLRQIFPSSPGRMKKEKIFLRKEKSFFLKGKRKADESLSSIAYLLTWNFLIPSLKKPTI